MRADNRGLTTQQRVRRRYDVYRLFMRDPYARNPQARGYSYSYGGTNRYGAGDPYYRDPYDGYWYGSPLQYYNLRRR